MPSIKSLLLCPVRIKGISPKVMKVIQMMRLRKIFSGTFIKINKTSMEMMKMVEPYVAWGWVVLAAVLWPRFHRGFHLGQSEHWWTLPTGSPTWSRSASWFWREARPGSAGGGFPSLTTPSSRSTWVRLNCDFPIDRSCLGKRNTSALTSMSVCVGPLDHY